MKKSTWQALVKSLVKQKSNFFSRSNLDTDLACSIPFFDNSESK